jgi:hypothetical protein
MLVHDERRSFQRAVFVAAGLYNILWGLYAVIDPQWLFRFARMQNENHPQVFACLGMVVGLYGIVRCYWSLQGSAEWVAGGKGSSALST